MNFAKVAVTWALLLTQASCTPPPGYVPKPDNDKDPPKYEFGYNINDGNGGSQGHIETRDGIFALGKYYVNLPGGSDQKVDYFADDWGYHPLVEYKSSSHSGSSSTQFAFGEKAVAALTKSNFAAPQLDFRNAQPLSAEPKPLLSIKSTLGVVPDHLLHNTKVEVISTTPSPSTVPSLYSPAASSQSLQSSLDTSVFKLVPNYSNFESQRTVFAQPELVSSNYVDNLATKQVYIPSPTIASYPTIDSFNTIQESTTYKPEVMRPLTNAAQDIKIVSYLADTNSAVDVSKESQAALEGGVAISSGSYSVQDGSIGISPGSHTISAILVEEGDHKHEDNAIGVKEQEIISTTSSPKTLFKPIVVADVTSTPLDTLDGPHETSIVYKDSKFYKTSLTQPELSDYKAVTDVSENVNLVATAIPEPVVVTPKPATKVFTSSDSILAPIQAAVTLSHSEDQRDCDINTNIDQADIEEKAVYTTSIDVQKSIPYEIVANHETEQHQQENLSYGNNYVQHPVSIDYQPSNSYSPNSFLQQVIESYQRLSGNSGYVEQNQRSSVIPLQNQQYVIPNRLYYVYLQRYNPYLNRYAESIGNNQYSNIQNLPLYAQTPSSHVDVLRHQVYPQSYTTQTGHELTNANYILPLVSDGRRPVNGNVGLNYLYKHTEGSGFASSKDEAFTVPASEFEKSIEKSEVSFSQSQRNGFVGDVGSSSSATLSDDYTKKEELANNLANLYATQLNALRTLDNDKSIQNAKEKEAYDLKVNNNGDYISNVEVNAIVDQQDPLAQVTYNTVQTINAKEENTNALEIQNQERNKFIELKTDLSLKKTSPKVELEDFSSAQSYGSSQVRTQIIEKPIPVEVTKVVEKPVPVPHPVPVTNVVHVEKPVAVPVPVTKLVPVDRPVAVPEPYPVPLPYEVPHPIGVPVPQFIPYPHVVPVPFKEYHPVYIYAKKDRFHQVRNEGDNLRHQKVFTPSHEVFTSQYPPRTYHVSGYMVGPGGRGQGKKLCIEYGGFKPPLVPSVQIDAGKKGSYR